MFLIFFHFHVFSRRDTYRTNIVEFRKHVVPWKRCHNFAWLHVNSLCAQNNINITWHFMRHANETAWRTPYRNEQRTIKTKVRFKPTGTEYDGYFRCVLLLPKNHIQLKSYYFTDGRISFHWRSCETAFEEGENYGREMYGRERERERRWKNSCHLIYEYFKPMSFG